MVRLATGFASRWKGIAPSLAAFVLCVLGAGFYLRHLNQSYRLEEWLAFRLLEIGLWTVLLHGSLVLVGARFLRLLVGRDELGPGELFLQSFVLGMGAFSFAMYLAGALSLYAPWFAVLLPVAFTVAGGSEALYLRGRLREALRPVPTSSVGASLLRYGAFAFGATMLVLVYVEALTPSSFNFDAIWYHVPVAQDYARLGKIVPFYGDNHRAYPHLTSLFQTWALLVPFLEPVQLKWMLILHLEFAIVVWRIVGAAAMARYLLGGRKIPGLWAVFFLFPSIFIYDQNIGGSADHYVGVTAVPIFLALMRTLPSYHAGYAILTGVAAGLHILTKYQAIYSVVAVAAFASCRSLYGALSRIYRARKGRPVPEGAPSFRALLSGPAWILLCALVVSAPHFIKNTVYYQNPVYPFAQKIFPSSFDDWDPPARAENVTLSSEARAKKREKSRSRAGEDDGPLPTQKSRKKDPWDFAFGPRGIDFKPQGDGPLEKVVWWHKTLADWPFLTGNRGFTEGRPYMGAVFVLLMPALLLIGRSRRVWLATGYVYVVFSVWAMTSANDRYLLTILSLPIGLCMALIVRVADLGKLAQVGLSCLLGVQLLWGADVPLQYGGARFADAVSLVRAGYSGKTLEERLRHRKNEITVSASLPKDAVVLGRYYKSLLGFDRTTLNTHADIQTYIDFKNLRSLDDFWQICRDRGVTHLLYPDGERQPVRAHELVLFDALVEKSHEKKKMSGLVIAELPKEPPGHTEPFLVLVRGVREYQDGLYPVHLLSLDSRREQKKGPKPLRPYRKENAEALLENASAVLLGGRKGTLDGASLDDAFYRVERFRGLEVWLRKDEAGGEDE